MIQTAMAERSFPADTAALPEVIAFAEDYLEQAECPMKQMMALSVALEELFVNIASYAYPKGEGEALFQIEAEEQAVHFLLKDRGIPFDPLAREDPDITLSAEERPIGGLGIYMVKKTMDEVLYEHRDGFNIIRVKKLIP